MTTAWLVLAAGDNRQHAGNRGYDDDPQRHYEWDSTVANHSRPSRGDMIALWDKNQLLGVSVIEKIDRSSSMKDRLRCPRCKRTNIKPRRTLRPKFKCGRKDCRFEFEEPESESIRVETFRTEHGAGWVDLEGRLDGHTLRGLCHEPKSQQSIRSLDWHRFCERLGTEDSMAALRIVEDNHRRIAGGHRRRTVRARIGQPSFRRNLERQYGSVCAFTGPQPREVLEAAHLYSFAESGEHHPHGGILLRRDLHRLYDLGLLTVDPISLRIRIGDSLKTFQDYARLNGSRLAIEVTTGVVDWLRIHWALVQESL